ncbi:DUF2889 domain-containing protein [Streptosporangium sp. NPDC002607]
MRDEDPPLTAERVGTAAATLGVLPERRRGSVRRTVTLDAAPDGSWAAGWFLTARARDLLTEAGGGTRVLDRLEISARIGAAGELRGLEVPTMPELAEALLGRDTRRGFRAVLANLSSIRPTSLEGALLDDFPGLGIVSGYGRLRAERATEPSMPASRRHPLSGTCMGWAPGGSAIRRATQEPPAGSEILSDHHAATPLAEMTDANGWHEDRPTRPGTVRRRRLLDVALDENSPIYSYFRDTYEEPDGEEAVIHEYELHARAHGTPPVLVSVNATPRPLPFAECPLAALNVGRLAGVALSEIDGAVRTTLTGTAGCTHLNDMLRTLRFVESLRAGPSRPHPSYPSDRPAGSEDEEGNNDA